MNREALFNWPIRLSSALGIFLTTVPNASALSFYSQFGGGIASVVNASPFLATSNSTLKGASGEFILGMNLQDSFSGLLFSVALQERLLSAKGAQVGSTSSKNFILGSTYPEFRIEFWRLILGVGYTPLVSDGIGFKLIHHTQALLLEGNFLFPISPEIDFGLSFNQQRFYKTATSPIATASEYGVFFRLNFGMSEGQRTERKKFKGWRYPLGDWLR